jgi:hypothetical protein
MPNLSTVTLAALSLALAGCARISPPQTVSRINPANPNVAQAGYPAAVPVLMVGTNYAMSPQADAQPVSVPEHDSHQMKMPQHEGHDKTSDQPAKHDHHEHNPPK